MGMLGKLKGAASLAKQAYDMAATPSAEAQIAGKVLQGPAGRHVHGIETAPEPPPRIEDAEWDRVMRADLAVRDAAREPSAGPGRMERTLDRVTDVVSVFDGDVYPTADFLPPRYCWPPA